MTSQRFQPREEVRGCPAWRTTVDVRRLAGVEGRAFHLEIDLDIAVRRLDARMAEPAAYDVELDAGLQEVEGRRVTKGVRTDTGLRKRRPGSCRSRDARPDDVAQAKPGQGPVIRIQKERPIVCRVDSTILQHAVQEAGRFGPDWAEPFFAAFTQQPDLRGCVEADRRQSHRGHFLSARSRVVEKLRQYDVAVTRH